MMRKMMMLGLAFGLQATGYAADRELTEVHGYIQQTPVGVTELTDVRVVDQVIGDSPLKSYMVVEVEGIYESHGESETLRVKLDRQDDGNPMNYYNYDAKLYSVVQSQDPVPVGSRFITSISHEKRFKTRFKLKINGWGGEGRAEFNVFFRYDKHQPVYHTESRGFRALLLHDDQRQKWVFNKIGFPRDGTEG